jgi:hypothetical protein
MSKIIVIGLPRTGTTSVSVALLEMGFLVAHMAFTKKAFEVAEAITDCPCFSDYMHLDELFPDSKFIYLSRDLDKWIPSITMLLEKMAPHLDAEKGRFNPIMKRSFKHTFSTTLPLTHTQLVECYTRHQQAVFKYFKDANKDRNKFLSIDISEPESLNQLRIFLGKEPQSNCEFPKLNTGRDVAGWHEYKHPNKVNSNLAGSERRKYFDYEFVGYDSSTLL